MQQKYCKGHLSWFNKETLCNCVWHSLIFGEWRLLYVLKQKLYSERINVWMYMRGSLKFAHTWHQGHLGYIKSQTCHWNPPCFHPWGHASCILVWLVQMRSYIVLQPVSFIMVAHHFDTMTHPHRPQIWKLELWAWPFWAQKNGLWDVMNVQSHVVYH